MRSQKISVEYAIARENFDVFTQSDILFYFKPSLLCSHYEFREVGRKIINLLTLFLNFIIMLTQWTKDDRPTSFHCTALCCASQMLQFLHIFTLTKGLQLTLLQCSLYCGALEVNLRYLSMSLESQPISRKTEGVSLNIPLNIYACVWSLTFSTQVCRAHLWGKCKGSNTSTNH